MVSNAPRVFRRNNHDDDRPWRIGLDRDGINFLGTGFIDRDDPRRLAAHEHDKTRLLWARHLGDYPPTGDIRWPMSVIVRISSGLPSTGDILDKAGNVSR